MKICMLSTGHNPLDDRIFYKETLSLRKKYQTIVLVMPGEKSDFENNNGIEYVPLHKADSLLTRFLSVPQALITLLKIKPQVCHFHDYELIFILPFLRFFLKCKNIYDAHENYTEMMLDSNKVPPKIKPYLAKFVDSSEKLFSRFADHVITPVEVISKRFMKFHRNVSTIYNYPKLSIFAPDKKEISKLKKRYKNRTLIIYHGSFSKQRGLFQMINAINILKSKKPDILLLLVGPINEELLSIVGNEIERMNLNNNVEIVGSVPHKDIVNYISICKVGLVPLFHTQKYIKSIPIKQFEYMACGVPVLGSNLPLIASYITSSGCGKVYDSNSPEALAAGVINIIEDEKEWCRMSEAGKKAVKDWWNWEIMEKKLFQAYETLLEK